MSTQYSKLENIFRGIWTVLNSRLFLLALIVIAVVLALNTCSNLREVQRQNIITEQNVIALTDSLTILKTKNGELQVQKSGYIAKEKELKLLNTSLYEQVRAQKGKVITLSNTVIRLEQTNEDLEKYIVDLQKKLEPPTQINDSTYVVPWILSYQYDSTNYDIFNGNTKVGITVGEDDNLNVTNLGSNLTLRTTQIGLTFGQKVVDKKLHVFVQSKYPGFTATSLDGVFIDPNTNPYIKKLIKKKRMTWFTSFGVGPSLTLSVNQTGVPFVVFGVGITWNVFNYKF